MGNKPENPNRPPDQPVPPQIPRKDFNHDPEPPTARNWHEAQAGEIKVRFDKAEKRIMNACIRTLPGTKIVYVIRPHGFSFEKN